jgi:hypothetical protein
MRRLKALINPLVLVDVEIPHFDVDRKLPTLEQIIEYLCPPGTPCDIESLISRYKEISTEPRKLSIAPAEQRILDKLIWPLRHAKASYMVGNYLSVIALCGMVAEMVAILLWETVDAQLNGKPMQDEDERAIFGSTFERLGQERRIRILSAYGLAGKEALAQFDIIKESRRKYLHLWSQDHDSLPQDAVKSFHSAVYLVLETIGQNFKDGMLVLNQRLVKYLERHGTYVPTSETV